MTRSVEDGNQNQAGLLKERIYTMSNSKNVIISLSPDGLAINFQVFVDGQLALDKTNALPVDPWGMRVDGNGAWLLFVAEFKDKGNIISSDTSVIFRDWGTRQETVLR